MWHLDCLQLSTITCNSEMGKHYSLNSAHVIIFPEDKILEVETLHFKLRLWFLWFFVFVFYCYLLSPFLAPNVTTVMKGGGCVGVCVCRRQEERQEVKERKRKIQGNQDKNYYFSWALIQLLFSSNSSLPKTQKVYYFFSMLSPGPLEYSLTITINPRVAKILAFNRKHL